MYCSTGTYLVYTGRRKVWDAIPIKDLRPFMRDTEERCKIIREKKGEWVGWSKDGVVRHGQSV